LIEDTRFLLLDEPTNHLDITTIAWFEEYLRTTDRSVLLLEHHAGDLGLSAVFLGSSEKLGSEGQGEQRRDRDCQSLGCERACPASSLEPVVRWRQSTFFSFFFFPIASKRYFPRVCISMGTYIPKKQFTGCADWSRDVARIRCKSDKR